MKQRHGGYIISFSNRCRKFVKSVTCYMNKYLDRRAGDFQNFVLGGLSIAYGVVCSLRERDAFSIDFD